MTNILSDYQKGVFFDIYKTSLGAMLSTEKFPDSIFINSAISTSVKIAMVSVELLTDCNGFRTTSEIIKTLEDKRVDEPIEFPKDIVDK